jgi:hypothetical protein
MIFGSGVLLMLVTSLVGRILRIGPLREWHESSFTAIVEALQQNAAVVDASTWLTDLGHINLNYVMLAALGVCAWLRPRCDTRAWLIGLLVTAMILRPFQGTVSRLVDGSTPDSPLVIGVAGPYFSGGVFRVTLIAALAGLVFHRSSRFVVGFAVLAGVFEGLTRLVLGRHWPLDIVAAVPIGLGAAFLIWQLVDLISGVAADPHGP